MTPCCPVIFVLIKCLIVCCRIGMFKDIHRCYSVFQSGRIGMFEDIDEFEGHTEAQIQEIMEEREARANAQILTMVRTWVEWNWTWRFVWLRCPSHLTHVRKH